MVAFVALFLILNVLLHSRLDDMEPQQSSNEMPHLRDFSSEKHQPTTGHPEELLGIKEPSPNIRKPVLLHNIDKIPPPMEKKPPELPVNTDKQRQPEKTSVFGSH